MLKKAFIAACAALLISLAINRLSPSPTVSDVYKQDAIKYTVTEYRGMVAVFRKQESHPIQILYSYVDALPTDMANQLQQGIPVHDEKELVRLLEKFSS